MIDALGSFGSVRYTRSQRFNPSFPLHRHLYAKIDLHTSSTTLSIWSMFFKSPLMWWACTRYPFCTMFSSTSPMWIPLACTPSIFALMQDFPYVQISIGQSLLCRPEEPYSPTTVHVCLHPTRNKLRTFAFCQGNTWASLPIKPRKRYNHSLPP